MCWNPGRPAPVLRIIINIDIDAAYSRLVRESVKECLKIYLKRDENIAVIVYCSGCTELLVALPAPDVKRLYEIAEKHPYLLSGLGIVSIALVGRPVIINVHPPAGTELSSRKSKHIVNMCNSSYIR